MVEYIELPKGGLESCSGTNAYCAKLAKYRINGKYNVCQFHLNAVLGITERSDISVGVAIKKKAKAGQEWEMRCTAHGTDKVFPLGEHWDSYSARGTAMKMLMEIYRVTINGKWKWSEDVREYHATAGGAV